MRISERVGKSIETGKVIFNEIKDKAHVGAKAVAVHTKTIASTSMSIASKPFTWVQKKYNAAMDSLMERLFNLVLNHILYGKDPQRMSLDYDERFKEIKFDAK